MVGDNVGGTAPRHYPLAARTGFEPAKGHAPTPFSPSTSVPGGHSTPVPRRSGVTTPGQPNQELAGSQTLALCLINTPDR